MHRKIFKKKLGFYFFVVFAHIYSLFEWENMYQDKILLNSDKNLL